MAAELSRHSHNVNTKMRKAVGPDGDVLDRIAAPGKFRNPKNVPSR
jgi:hypothetical protein